MQLTLGKILRRPPASLGGPQPLHRPGPAAGQAPSGFASGSVPSARSSVDGLDVGTGEGGGSVVPLAARPHLRSSCARPRTAWANQTEYDWLPPELPACYEGAGCLVPTEKDRTKPFLNPATLPRRGGAGRRGEPGSQGAQTRSRGGVSHCAGRTSRDQIEQPAWRDSPWLGRGRGVSSLTRLVDGESLSPPAASARAVCWFPFIGLRATPGFPSFVARK